jgi:hypothetical protein
VFYIALMLFLSGGAVIYAGNVLSGMSKANSLLLEHQSQSIITAFILRNDIDSLKVDIRDLYDISIEASQFISNLKRAIETMQHNIAQNKAMLSIAQSAQKRLISVPLTLMVSPAEAYVQMTAPNGIMHDEFAAFASAQHNMNIDTLIAQFMTCMTPLRFNLAYINRAQKVKFIHSEWTLRSTPPNVTFIAIPTELQCRYAEGREMSIAGVVNTATHSPTPIASIGLPTRDESVGRELLDDSMSGFDELFAMGIWCDGYPRIAYRQTQSDQAICYNSARHQCSYVAQIC